jgi:hypothetical protein
MEPSRDDVLFATLESLRPGPSPAFAAELDELVSAGFQRRSHNGAEPGWRLLVDWLRTLSPRRLVFAGGAAVALATIAVAVVVIASGSSSGTDQAVSGTEQTGSGTLGYLNKFPDGSAPPAPEQQSRGESGGAEEASAAAGSASAPSSSATQTAPGSGPYASQAHHRDVEYAAEMVLGTKPEEVGDAAGKIFDTVHQYGGIVLDSSVSGGSEGDAGAKFELLVPSAKLGDALAAFSDIADVRSRHETSNDITAPTVTTTELLQDSHARVESLLNELANTETEAERDAVEAKLRSERRHAAQIKASLTNLQRRANFSHVSLRIESSASNAPSGAGGWGLDDAFHDAGHILAVAAGVAIVGLAVIGPIALIALLIWLGNRAWVRQRRERALG